MIIYGINPVTEALRAGQVTELRVSDRAGDRAREVAARAAEQGVPVRRVPAHDLDRQARGGVHQGVVADVRRAADWSLEALVAEASDVPLLVVLDGIEDPHNVGAILRTCDAAGVDGIVRQSRRAAPLEGATAKVSAGAVAHVRIAEVVNIARAIDELKTLGVWIVGLAGEGATPYDKVDFTVPTALVVGAEGTGLRRLTRDKCDVMAQIPMRGHVESLNVSVATAVALFEARRQRDRSGEGGTSR